MLARPPARTRANRCTRLHASACTAGAERSSGLSAATAAAAMRSAAQRTASWLPLLATVRVARLTDSCAELASILRADAHAGVLFVWYPSHLAYSSSVQRRKLYSSLPKRSLGTYMLRVTGSGSRHGMSGLLGACRTCRRWS